LNLEQKPLIPEQKPLNTEQKPLIPEQKPLNTEQPQLNTSLNTEQKPLINPLIPEQTSLNTEQKPLIPDQTPDQKPLISEQKPLIPEQNGGNKLCSFDKSGINISKNDELFIKYAKNIKDMINTAANNQHKLLSVINDLFIFVKDPYSDKKKIRVNPTLTESKLDKLIVQTRNIIIELYVKCEKDFVTGIKLYEAIVEKKILETTKQQIVNLEKSANQIINEIKTDINN
jgi:hypothetical protein